MLFNKLYIPDQQKPFVNYSTELLLVDWYADPDLSFLL